MWKIQYENIVTQFLSFALSSCSIFVQNTSMWKCNSVCDAFYALIFRNHILKNISGTAIARPVTNENWNIHTKVFGYFLRCGFPFHFQSFTKYYDFVVETLSAIWIFQYRPIYLKLNDHKSFQTISSETKRTKRSLIKCKTKKFFFVQK